MVSVRVLSGKNPDARFYSVNHVELSLGLYLVDDQTVRAIIDRYSREEVEYSHFLHWFGLLVLCRSLLDRLEHLVQRFIIWVDVFEHAEIKFPNELFNLCDL